MQNDTYVSINAIVTYKILNMKKLNLTAACCFTPGSDTCTWEIGQTSMTAGPTTGTPGSITRVIPCMETQGHNKG